LVAGGAGQVGQNTITNATVPLASKAGVVFQGTITPAPQTVTDAINSTPL
jgi:hypothetical protein